MNYITNHICLVFALLLCTLTATHLMLIYVHSAEWLIKQAGIIIGTILNLGETLGIEPVTCGSKNVYKPAALPLEPFRQVDNIILIELAEVYI